MRPEKIQYLTSLPCKVCVRQVEACPYHWHDALEILLVLEGSINIGIGDDNLLLGEGDIAVINMDELHRMTRTQEDNKILHLYISPQFIKQIMPDNQYLFIYCCSAYHRDQAPERYDKLKAYIASLMAALQGNPVEDRQIIKVHLKDMLDYIVYSFDLLRWGFGTTPLDDRRVERLQKMAIQTSSVLDGKVGLRDMMSIIDVTLSHLSYDIKRTFGLTFQELLFYSKCMAAGKLLLSTNERIVDIALNCGFSDVKYLIKHFKRFFGHTPSSFRREYRVDDATLTSQRKYKELSIQKIPFP